jgi:predicted acyltransferase
MRTEPTPQVRGDVEAHPETNASRRRLLRGGLGAAPVLMTAFSKPVIAGGVNCAPASSFASLNTSLPGNVVLCMGHTPDFWVQPQQMSAWPSPYVPNGGQATLFDTVFGSSGGYPGKTLRNVLSFASIAGRDALARYIVAALLNAAKGITPASVMSVGTVKTIWTAFCAVGYYEPTAGIRWYPDSSVPPGSGGLIVWLKTTMS